MSTAEKELRAAGTGNTPARGLRAGYLHVGTGIKPTHAHTHTHTKATGCLLRKVHVTKLSVEPAASPDNLAAHTMPFFATVPTCAAGFLRLYISHHTQHGNLRLTGRAASRDTRSIYLTPENITRYSPYLLCEEHAQFLVLRFDRRQLRV